MRTHACNTKPCTLTHIALTYSFRGRPAGSATSQQIKLWNRDLASQTCPKQEEPNSNSPAPAVGHNNEEEENEPEAAGAAIEEAASEADEAEADEPEADEAEEEAAGHKETKDNVLLALERAIEAAEAAKAAEVAKAAEAAEAAKISLKVSSRSPLFLSLPPFQPVNLRVFCSPSSFARFGPLGPRSPYLSPALRALYAPPLTRSLSHGQATPDWQTVVYRRMNQRKVMAAKFSLKATTAEKKTPSLVGNPFAMFGEEEDEEEEQPAPVQVRSTTVRE